MVATTVALPNIRDLFIPDPGYMIMDADLAQADAQVVAWEANDEKLKTIFRDPTADLHNANALTIFGDVTKRTRQLAKGGVHAVNYGAKARTLAKALGVSVAEAERFIRLWFAAHPGIKEWQSSIELELATTRRVINRFGNMRHYFERVDTLLPEALAWIPQSTVALVINRGLVAIDKDVPEVDVLMQVHDSLVMQVPKRLYRQALPKIKKALEVVIPYDDPLIIQVGIAVSEVSWGQVQDVDWEGNLIKEN